MATKINMIGIIITSDKDDKREKKEHSVFVYPIHSKDDLLWGREQLFVTLIQRVWLQRESHNNYKNKPSILILPFFRIFSRGQKTQ
jgi:hypothetical protein